MMDLHSSFPYLTYTVKQQRGGEERMKMGGVPSLSPPRLGRGFAPGTELDLNSSSPSNNRATLAKVTLYVNLALMIAWVYDYNTDLMW